MLDRRAFLGALGLLATPLTAAAQPAGKVPRIGVLGPRTSTDGARYLDPFRRGMRELGWVEGQNILIEYRWAEGRSERIPGLAAELVRLNVDVIFAGTTAMTVAAREATSTIPIVMATGGDPVAIGLVASLARPGGNVTGLSFSVGSETFAKQIELLKETVPTVRRVAMLFNPANPSNRRAVDRVRDAARSVGVSLQVLEVRAPDDFERAFAMMARARAEALLVVADSILSFHRSRLQDFVVRSRLPAIYGLREHVEGGGLMSYAADVRDNFRRAAGYVDKILKGARPGDLPVEQPTKFELVINLKAAKALGFTIPPSLLQRADQVIDP
jgi:putative ABC transport system substrate-binding protein